MKQQLMEQAQANAVAVLDLALDCIERGDTWEAHRLVLRAKQLLKLGEDHV